MDEPKKERQDMQDILLSTVMEHLQGDFAFYFDRNKRANRDLKESRKKFSIYLLRLLIQTKPTNAALAGSVVRCDREALQAYLFEIFLTNKDSFKRMLNETSKGAKGKAQVNKDEPHPQRPKYKLDSAIDIAIEDLANHTRLYLNIMLYQLTSINNLSYLSIQHASQLDVYFDHLLYLPAYPLIEEHRIETRISPHEDQILRRGALLLLVEELERYTRPRPKGRVIIELLILIISKNDYLSNQMTLSTESKHHLRPAHQSPGTNSEEEFAGREFVFHFERLVIERVVNNCLIKRLHDWVHETTRLGKIETEEEKDIELRARTLLTLRLVKLIIRHHKLKKSKISDEVHALGSRIQTTLKMTIMQRFERRVTDLIRADHDHANPVNESNNLVDRHKPKDSWNQLLQDVQMLNNDLKFYWSRRGFDGLMRKPPYLLAHNDASTEGKQDISLKILIEKKLKAYLKS